MNYNFNNYNITTGIQGFQDNLKSLEFEKEKYTCLIKQINEEIEEIKSKTIKLKTEGEKLIEQKHDYYLKLDLYRSITNKLNENIERTNWSKKLTLKNINIAKTTVERLRKENLEKLQSKMTIFQNKMQQMDQLIEEQFKQNDSMELFEKIQVHKSYQERIEKLKELKIQYLNEISEIKIKNNNDWVETKNKIVEM
ncbi:unnamed protein product [Brachionus calyciflorus]|uniref:Uncharacterized protein n=1 Tax=Brachionus calyciflorus TaxID=104777 RepID=A0A813TPJ9_9BILA|nr:unnamed protein product [Brachionus calyciflorus]